MGDSEFESKREKWEEVRPWSPQPQNWEFGSDREMQETVRKTRKQPLTAKRLGEIIGGTIAVSVVMAASALHFIVFLKFDALYGYVCSAAAALFAGAWVGGQVGNLFRRNRKD